MSARRSQEDVHHRPRGFPRNASLVIAGGLLAAVVAPRVDRRRLVERLAAASMTQEILWSPYGSGRGHDRPLRSVMVAIVAPLLGYQAKPSEELS